MSAISPSAASPQTIAGPQQTVVSPQQAVAAPQQTIAAPWQNTAAPLEKKDRIRFLDCLRGLAILGILIMNIMGSAQSGIFYNKLDLAQPVSGLNFYSWVVSNGLVEGVMRALFSILFGAGSMLLIERLEKNTNGINPADIYFRRVMWLFLFGLFNAYCLLWWGDILFHYGLLSMVLWSFFRMSPKQLLIPIFIVLTFGIVKESIPLNKNKVLIAKGRQAAAVKDKGQKLTTEQTDDLAKWEKFAKTNSTDSIMEKGHKQNSEFRNKPLGKKIAEAYEQAGDLEITSFFYIWFDVILLFLVGIFLYKTGYITGQCSTRTYLIAGVGCTIAGLGMSYYDNHEMLINHFDVAKITERAIPVRLHQLKRVLQAVGYIGLLQLLYSSASWFRRGFNLLAPVGQMAFTNYLLQSIFFAVAFILLPFYGRMQRYEIFGVALGFYIAQVIFSHIWLRYYRFGPFEWAWRSLTYWKLQPMRKPSVNPVSSPLLSRPL